MLHARPFSSLFCFRKSWSSYQANQLRGNLLGGTAEELRG
jgi:hypothetical protein